MDPTLPIPNREVKRNHADGTALPGGRVGSRRSLTKALESSDSGAFFVYPAPVGLQAHRSVLYGGEEEGVSRGGLAGEAATRWRVFGGDGDVGGGRKAAGGDSVL